MSKELIKNQSKLLKKSLKKYGYEIKHSHALEAMSHIHDSKNWHIANQNKSNLIRTGIKEFDKDIEGGIPLGSLVFFVGGANVGKSSICDSIVCNNIRDKKNNLIINLENLHIQKIEKFIYNLTNMKYSKYINKTLSKNEENLLREKSKLNHKYFKIKNIKNFDMDLSKLTQELIELKAEYDFKLLEIDSIQLIDYKNQEEMLNNLKKISQLAKALNIVIISPIQALKNLGINNKGFIDTSSLNEFNQITEVADIVFTIKKKNNDVSLFLDKNKFDLKRKEYKLKINPDVFNWIL